MVSFLLYVDTIDLLCAPVIKWISFAKNDSGKKSKCPSKTSKVHIQFSIDLCKDFLLEKAEKFSRNK